jgi:hypothetical protein
MRAGRTGVRPPEVRRGARFTLFVEGDRDDGLDPQVLSTLLDDTGVSVKPLGSCFGVTAAAEALHKHQREYLFLVDRDYQSDEDVERCWESFLDPNTRNLLIWRRRELESYFLIPDYLAQSPHLQPRSRADLENRILREARQRVFMDAANRVIVTLREEMRQKWIQIFGNHQEFTTREAALGRLLAHPQMAAKRAEDGRRLSSDWLENRFAENLELLCGGADPLEFARGRWLELMCAKPILKQVINTCFQVRDSQGASLDGTMREREVIRGLLRMPLDQQPADFQQLRSLIHERVR